MKNENSKVSTTIIVSFSVNFAVSSLRKPSSLKMRSSILYYIKIDYYYLFYIYIILYSSKIITPFSSCPTKLVFDPVWSKSAAT